MCVLVPGRYDDCSELETIAANCLTFPDTSNLLASLSGFDVNCVADVGLGQVTINTNLSSIKSEFWKIWREWQFIQRYNSKLLSI